MAEGVLSFCKEHPYEDAGFGAVMARFEERVGRANQLVTQERAGRLASSAATKEKGDLRRELQGQLLSHLVRVSEVAAKERPELAERFRRAGKSVAGKVFLTTARAILADAQEFTELLVQHGMSATMFAELKVTLERLEAVTEASRKARRDHVGANADLGAVSRELLELVGLLDGLNRFRFRDQPELLAAWESARNVVGPVKSKAESAEAGGNGTGAPTKPGDDLSHAA
jgi:hypothetical protein